MTVVAAPAMAQQQDAIQEQVAAIIKTGAPDANKQVAAIAKQNKKDVNAFFLRLQEQDETVASWSDKTIAKLSQVLVKLLVDNDYLDNTNSNQLNPVLISSVLENALRAGVDTYMLPAFNCF